jgi:hypothetical protein
VNLNHDIECPIQLLKELTILRWIADCIASILTIYSNSNSSPPIQQLIRIYISILNTSFNYIIKVDPAIHSEATFRPIHTYSFFLNDALPHGSHWGIEFHKQLTIFLVVKSKSFREDCSIILGNCFLSAIVLTFQLSLYALLPGDKEHLLII